MSNRIISTFQSSCFLISLFFFTTSFFVITVSVSLTTVTYLLSFLFLLLSFHQNTQWYRIFQNPGALSFWILMLLFVIGFAYTTSTTNLAWQDLQKRHWLLFTPFFIMILTQEVWRQRMMNTFLFSITMILLISYFKVLTHADIYRFFPYVRPQESGGVFMNHIAQNLAMNIAAFIAGYRCLFEKKYRLYYTVLFILIGINILFFSTGRTSYGTFVLLLGYLSLIRLGVKGLFISAMISIALISAAFLISADFRTRILMIDTEYQRYRTSTEITSVGQRIEMIHIAKQMIAKRLWFGYGTGGIRTALPIVVAEKDRQLNPSIDYVENIYLNFLLEFGVIGLLVLIAAIVLQVKASFQLPDFYRYLFRAVLIAILFGGCFNAFFVSFVPAHLYALFSAICLSAFRDEQY